MGGEGADTGVEGDASGGEDGVGGKGDGGGGEGDGGGGEGGTGGGNGGDVHTGSLYMPTNVPPPSRVVPLSGLAAACEPDFDCQL